MNRYKESAKRMYVLVIAGAVPLLIWRFQAHTHWPDYILVIYVMTAVLFGILLLGQYPEAGTRWFWKSMIPISLIHGATVAAALSLTMASINLQLPTRMTFGLVGTICLLEWWICVRIINALRPKGQ